MENNFSDSNCLVVGGAGFVGSNLVKKLLKAGSAKITVVDNFLSAEKSNVPSDSRIVLLEGSITDDGILERLKDEYDYIFHLATYHGNQSSIHDPLSDHENNTLTTLKLFEKIKDFKNLKKVVYSSAGCSVAPKTFDKAEASTEVEYVSLKMDSPYSISKIIGEFYSLYYHKQHALPTVRARFQNVYGPGEILGAGEWRGTPATVWRNVTPTFVFRALKGWPLTVENQGIATRDFIFVEDVAEGLMACALKGEPGEVYNIAGGEETSIMELAEKINALAENGTPVRYLPKRDWDNSGKRFGSTEKARKALGFSAGTSFDEGIKKTIDWTRANMAFIEETMAKHKANFDYLNDK